MAESSQQPFEVNDFSGGVTDDVYDQTYNRAFQLDNYNITPDKKILTRDGSVIDDLVNPQIPAGVSRIGTLINYYNSTKLFVHSVRAFYYRNPSAYATLVGPAPGHSVLSAGSATSALSYSQFKGHIFLTSDAFPRPMKIYQDGSGNYQVRNSNVPALASAPVVTAGAAGANNYIYAFHYKYDYTALTEDFEDVGTVTEVPLQNSGDPSVNPNAITAIPVLGNGTGDNYDLSNIKIVIYRTISNGTAFFRLGEVANTTTTFTDNFSDASIINNLELYIDGGVVDHDEAPLSKYIHIVNGISYYGWIKDPSGEFPFRIIQGIPGAPGAVSNSFLKDAEDSLMGISSVKSIPIVLCARHIYRVESSIDEFGRGDFQLVRISDTAGCISNLSCVQAEDGLFWAGNDGFYYTDGYQVQKISDHLNPRYQNILDSITQKNRIYGKFDEKQRRIYWAVEQDSGSLDNDSFLALDLRWGLSNKMSFTTWSGKSFRPTALEYFNFKLYRADTRGYVFRHDPDQTADPKVDTTVAASAWVRETIIWNYQSVNVNFGSTFFRKMATRLLITAGNLDNTTIQPSAVNDDNKIARVMKTIRWRRNFIWRDPDFVWRNPDCVWSGTGLIEQWRRFPAKGLRFSYVQIIITNGYGVITNSNTLGNATFNNVAKTITLDVGTNSWPSESVDYYISSEIDNYQKQYLVTVRNSNTVLTVLDVDNTLPIGDFKWLLSGFARGEPLWLLSYNIFWNNVSQTQATFEVGQDGGN